MNRIRGQIILTKLQPVRQPREHLYTSERPEYRGDGGSRKTQAVKINAVITTQNYMQAKYLQAKNILLK
jgi:hypothetical protein